jgi:protein-disulfide isomerase
MSEKPPPGRRRTPSPNVDLDADLWSGPAQAGAEPEPRRAARLRSVPASDSPTDDPPGALADAPDSGHGAGRTVIVSLPDPVMAPGDQLVPVIIQPKPTRPRDDRAAPAPGGRADGRDDQAAPSSRSRADGRDDRAAPSSRSRADGRDDQAAPSSRRQSVSWDDDAGSASRGATTTRARVAAANSRTAARDRLREERQRESRRRRRRRLAKVGTGLALLVIAGAATLIIREHATASETIVGSGSRYDGPYAPVTVTSGSVTMAQPGVTEPVLDVYEDFQCQPCREFEKANGGVIQQLADLGKIKVVYYPFTIFSDQPAQANSTRAWAAARCAPAAEWVSYHNALFARQPPQTKAGGFPVSQLLQLGKSAGISGTAFAHCVNSQQYAGMDAPVSNQILSSSGPDGLPTLRLNGQLLTANPMSPALRLRLISASS